MPGRPARRRCSTGTSSGSESSRSGTQQVTEAFRSARIVDTAAPDWYEETPTRVRAVPVLRRLAPSGKETTEHPVAVITRHTNLSEARTPSRQELTFNECANDLFTMIASGDFPDLAAPSGPRRGAPRASDGLIRLDVDGIVTFASPNGLSAFNRMGFAGELEGESLAEVTTQLLQRQARRRRVAAARGHRPGTVAHRHRGARGDGVAARHPDPRPGRARRRHRAVP